jgi:ArsR family transcriptional regulator, arsenate/arsenite/antimonite-responsive transcriptional repressor
MTEEQRKYFGEMAQISKALAHPTRLFIVHVLSEKEHCVCELTELIEADTSTVSKHLSVLKNAGIITFEKRANMVYYRLLCPCVLDFFQCIVDVIDAKTELNGKQIRQVCNLNLKDSAK